jgi:hypothetical protein
LQLADACIEVSADMLDGEIDHLRIELGDEYAQTHGEQNQVCAVPGDKASAGCKRNHGTSCDWQIDLRDGCVGATRFQMGNPVENRMFRHFDSDRTFLFCIALRSYQR